MMPDDKHDDQLPAIYTKPMKVVPYWQLELALILLALAIPCAIVGWATANIYRIQLTEAQAAHDQIAAKLAAFYANDNAGGVEPAIIIRNLRAEVEGKEQVIVDIGGQLSELSRQVQHCSYGEGAINDER